LAAAAFVAFNNVYACYNAAKAANTWLEFSEDNQQAFLEVMTYYFTSPEEGRDSDSDKDGVPDDRQVQLQSRTRITTKHDTIIFTILNVELSRIVQN